MIIVPKTARRFHEILLGTTMRQVPHLAATDVSNNYSEQRRRS